MKVLIIDTNDARRKAITIRLRDAGLIVTSMYMISNDNLKNILASNDALVVLDQDESMFVNIVAAIDGQAVKCISNQRVATLIPSHSKENIIYIHHEHTNDIEEEIVAKLESWHSAPAYVQPIAEDQCTQSMLEMARKIAAANATVLICGETGTGKEVLAKYIHQYSTYSKGPCVSVNCAALPENMMEAILFGYEKGAFTSAVSTYIGKFEQAQNGTLMLDEISEMALGLQAKLLRVLQEKELERLGGKKIIKLNVRLIAATNRDLKQQVTDGLFRKDLYYRLNVLPIHCPALRDRPKDILALTEYFIKQYAPQSGCDIAAMTSEAKDKLLNYNWPGNVRELENVIQRALILRDGGRITAKDITLDQTQYDITNHQDKQNVITHLDQFRSRLEENEAKVIIDVLNETDGCRNSAARKLNISPRTLRYKLAKLRAIGLKVP